MFKTLRYKLSQYEWYRKFINTWFDKVFLLVGQPDSTNTKYCNWIEEKDYKFGDKIIDRYSNTIHNKIWCSCGNEIFCGHSEKKLVVNPLNTIYEIHCAHCQLKQYWIWGIIPGYIECDSNGKPKH